MVSQVWLKHTHTHSPPIIPAYYNSRLLVVPSFRSLPKLLFPISLCHLLVESNSYPQSTNLNLLPVQHPNPLCHWDGPCWSSPAARIYLKLPLSWQIMDTNSINACAGSDDFTAVTVVQSLGSWSFRVRSGMDQPRGWWFESDKELVESPGFCSFRNHFRAKYNSVPNTSWICACKY